MGKKKVHEIEFVLNAEDAENLWGLISNAQSAKLDPSSGVPYELHELRCSLDELRQEPDDDKTTVQQLPDGTLIGSPKRQAYCKKHDLSLQYFPKEVKWVFRKKLLKILKLVLKATVASTTGHSFAHLIKLCKTLRLSAWFRANFKKVTNIDLGEDDRDLDDELDPEDLSEEEEEEEEEEPATDPDEQVSE